MQNPVITKCPTMPAQGYGELPPMLKQLETLSREYPLLKTNKPMNWFFGKEGEG